MISLGFADCLNLVVKGDVQMILHRQGCNPIWMIFFQKGYNAIYKSVEYDVNLFNYCEFLKHDRTNDVPSVALDIASPLYQPVKRKYILKWPGGEGDWGT